MQEDDDDDDDDDEAVRQLSARTHSSCVCGREYHYLRLCSSLDGDEEERVCLHGTVQFST